MSKNFSSISQVLSSSALEQKKHFEAILPRPVLEPLKYAYFIEKTTKSVEKVSILALDMTFWHKFGPRTDLGCPWLNK
jgi:hypothetical protein